LPELVSGIEEREEEIVVTRNGKPAAVLVNYDEYERLKGSLEVLSDPDLMKQILRSESFMQKESKACLSRPFLANLFRPGSSENGNDRLPARYPAARGATYTPLPAGVETQRQAGHTFFKFKPILKRATSPRIDRLMKIQGETASPHL
jgi:prevent-host-death family protein